MSDQRHANIRRIVFALAEAAPEPLTHEQLTERQVTGTSRTRGWKTALVAAAVLLIVLGVPLILLGWLPDQSPAEPRVTKGIRVSNLAPEGLRNTDEYVLSPDGSRAVVVREGSWCIADLPALAVADEDPPITIEGLNAGTQELRCADSPFIWSPRWSPDGTRIVAFGQEGPSSRPPGLDEDLAQLYFLDASNLQVEAIVDGEPGTLPIWLNDEEVLYNARRAEDSVWIVVAIDGSVRSTIPAPRPYLGPAVPVDDSTAAYVTVNTDTFAQEGSALDATLMLIDIESGSATALAPLSDLNPGGDIPDPGYVTAMTPDLRYAVLIAVHIANETGRGPTTYVFDVENRVLIPHTAPGYGSESRTLFPYLLGEGWIAYTPVPDPTTDEPDDRLRIFIAPLDEPRAGFEIFQDGQLVAAQGNRLLILAEDPVILELDF